MTAVLGVLSTLWARASAPSPPPGPWEAMLATVVVVALVLAPTWPTMKHAVTLVHEAGHGAVATLTRRRLRGIRLHSDTSGLTVSVGPGRGPGMAATLLAGYPAPCVAGLLIAAAVAAGHAPAALWGCLVLLVGVLVQIRNWFGLWSVLACGAVVGAATWFADPAWSVVLALAVAALLLVGGLRAAVELPFVAGRDRASDAGQLARVTGVPAPLWLAAFVLAAAACTAGATLLVVQALPSAA